MRKYRRQLIKLTAVRQRMKSPSKMVAKVWEKYQTKKYGTKTVAINRAKGTHKKHLWGERIAFALYGLKKGRVA